MGKASVQLPDPLEKPPLGANASADDLLSQLAGDEIDRLLSEATEDAMPADAAAEEAAAETPAEEGVSDVAENMAALAAADAIGEGEAAAPPLAERVDAPPPPATTDPDADPEMKRQLDALVEGLKQAEAAAQPAQGRQTAPHASATSNREPAVEDAELAKQLDTLFQELTAPVGGDEPSGSTSPEGQTTAATVGTAPGVAAHVAIPVSTAAQETGAAGMAAAAAAVEVPRAAAPAEPAPAAAVELDPREQSGKLERDVLAAPLVSQMQAPAATTEDQPETAEESIPVYVRVLEWLNAPLAGCSESAREAIGKVAIITLVNALAVLLYVVIFGPLL